MPLLGGGCLEHVGDILPVNFVRHVVADIDVALITHHTHHVIALVHAAAKAVDVGLLRRGVFAHEGITLHMLRRLDPRNTQKRGS